MTTFLWKKSGHIGYRGKVCPNGSIIETGQGENYGERDFEQRVLNVREK